MVEMVSAKPEAGGIEAVQGPDPAAKGAAPHPLEVLFRDSFGGQTLSLPKHRLPDGPGVIGIPGTQQHGAAVNDLKAAAEGGCLEKESYLFLAG